MKLSVKQQQAIIHLAAGDRKAEVAKKVRVNPCTIYRWLNDEGFTHLVELETLRQIDELRQARSPLIGSV